MKVAIFPNMDKCGVEEITCNAVKQLKSLKIDVFVPEDIDFVDCNKLSNEELYKSCDIIVTVGGDGTLISHAKAASI